MCLTGFGKVRFTVLNSYGLFTRSDPATVSINFCHYVNGDGPSDSENGCGTLLPVRRTITIGTIIKLDGDGDGDGDGVRTCKQAFNPQVVQKQWTSCQKNNVSRIKPCLHVTSACAFCVTIDSMLKLTYMFTLTQRRRTRKRYV